MAVEAMQTSDGFRPDVEDNPRSPRPIVASGTAVLQSVEVGDTSPLSPDRCEESEDGGDRKYQCAECGKKPQLGAVDPEDGQWYCKSCWESFLEAEGTEADEEAEALTSVGLDVPNVPDDPSTPIVDDASELAMAAIQESSEPNDSAGAAIVSSGLDENQEGKRQYQCGDCGESPELGAEDEHGVWYCKACWESFIANEAEEEEGEEADEPKDEGHDPKNQMAKPT